MINNNFLNEFKLNFLRDFDDFFNELKYFFSERQINIILLKFKGYKNVEIAKKLNVSPSTITLEIKRIAKTFLEDPELNNYFELWLRKKK